MDEKSESEIQAKRDELKEANKKVQKYAATVPLSANEAIGHSAEEMKRDFENRDRIEKELMSLLK